MSLRAKFAVGYALIAALALSLALYGIHAIGLAVEQSARVQADSALGHARAAEISFNQARGVMDQILLAGPEASAGLVASLLRTQSDIAEALRLARALVPDGPATDATDRAQAAVTEWFGGDAGVWAASADAAASAAITQAFEQHRLAALSRLTDLAVELAANEERERVREAAWMRRSYAVVIVLAGGIVALGGLLMLLLVRGLIRPLHHATGLIKDIAAGHYTNVVTSRGRDEIGYLMRALATMRANVLRRRAQALELLREKATSADLLRQTNLRFDAALNNMAHGLLMCDADSRVVVVNRQFFDLSGIPHGSITPNMHYSDVLALSIAAGNHPGRTLSDVLAEQEQAFNSRQSATMIKSNPLGRTIEILVEPMADGGWVATQRDITERRRSEERITFLARHDALTYLPNRITFRERLSHALAQAERGDGFALLYLDLDRFKTVNDTLGHLIGDQLLQAVADRLRDAAREVDTVARLGGDEFAIIQSDASNAAQASLLAARITEVISRPFEIEGHRIAIGVSIGIALAPADSTHPVALMKHADLAMYRAKQDGRNTWRFFEPAMDALAQARLELEFDLRDALPLGQFELHYQPLISSRDRRLSGFEVLLRWNHPRLGQVQPGQFISIAEETGLIAAIGAWVLHQACAEAATWPDHLRLAVNLSPLQFRGEALLPAVSEALRRSNLSARRMEFEITESVLLQDDLATRTTLHALRAMGARIALDDFGTGYSSLSYLRSFPFDSIKIDRSFVSGLGMREDCVAIVRAIIGLGNSLHMHTLAEGVQTAEQFEFLVAAGCTEQQGYLFSSPVPASVLPGLIDRLSRPWPTAEAAYDRAWQTDAAARAS